VRRTRLSGELAIKFCPTRPAAGTLQRQRVNARMAIAEVSKRMGLAAEGLIGAARNFAKYLRANLSHAAIRDA